MKACPACGSTENFMVYPINPRLVYFTCFACGEDTPYEVAE